MNESGRRVPWLYRVVRARAGQSEPLAVVLLFGLVVAGMTAVVAVGGDALEESQRSADMQRTENAMTLLDSRGAMTALGDSDTQRVALGGSEGGQYAVRPDSGWLRVVHVNFTEEGDNETIYNASLGSVAYRNGDELVAYEGGGVWRTTDRGTSMVSPPEFHYQAATLTLPVVRVSGTDARSGRTAARITPVTRARRVFPNASVDETEGENETGAPYDVTDAPYRNPVANGTVVVTVRSAHYRGWAEYFRTRTSGTVTVDDDARTASIELKTLGLVGFFEMPREGNSVRVRGVAGSHNVSNYSLTLRANPHFQNLHWSMYHDSPGQDFELHVHSDSQCTGGSYDGELDVSIYYDDGAGGYEGWQNSSIDPSSTSAFDVDCSKSPAVLTANFTSDTPMTYGDISMSGDENKWYFGPEIKDGSVDSEVEFDDHHPDDFDADGSPKTYNETEAEEMGFLVNHYFSLMSPKFELTVTDGPGGSERVDEGASSGRLDYDAAEGRHYITFLHVTENEIRVDLE